MANGNITYAQKARQIINKYKKRLGENLDGMDKPSKEAMDKELENLKQEQELDRAIMYKDMNKGMSMEEFAYGGLMPKLGGGGYGTRDNPLTSNNWLKVMPDGTIYDPSKVQDRSIDYRPDLIPSVNYGNVSDNRATNGYLFNRPPAVDLTRPAPVKGIDTSFMNPNIPVAQPTGAPSQASAPATGSATTTPTRSRGTKVAPITREPLLTPMTGRNLDFRLPATSVAGGINGNDIRVRGNFNAETDVNDRPYRTQVSPLGLAPALIGYGLNRRAIRDMSKIKYTPQGVSPERISLASARSAMDARRRERNNMVKGISGNLSGSQRYANALAGITESDRGYGEEVNSSYLAEATTNAEANNRAKLYNAESASRAQEANNQMRMNTIQARLANNQGLVAAGAGYMKDVNQARQWDSMSDLMSDNYRAVTPGSYYQKPLYKRASDYILGRGADKRYAVKQYNKVSS